MLVVKIEMWPKGDESKAYEYCRATIVNDFKESLFTGGETGNYLVKFMQNIKFNPKKVWKSSKTGPIHRTRRGVWDILYVALRNAGLDRRNPE